MKKTIALLIALITFILPQKTLARMDIPAIVETKRGYCKVVRDEKDALLKEINGLLETLRKKDKERLEIIELGNIITKLDGVEASLKDCEKKLNALKPRSDADKKVNIELVKSAIEDLVIAEEEYLIAWEMTDKVKADISKEEADH